jgi:hypothetical protein
MFSRKRFRNALRSIQYLRKEKGPYTIKALVDMLYMLLRVLCFQ